MESESTFDAVEQIRRERSAVMSMSPTNANDNHEPTGSNNSSSTTNAPSLTRTQSSSRKRRRIVIPSIISSASTTTTNEFDAYHRHRQPIAWLPHGDNDVHDHDQTPDTTSYAQLLAALLITTGLSIVSAYDAKEQCMQLEDETYYALLDLVDDNNFQAAYYDQTERNATTTTNCLPMFQTMATTASIILGLGCLGLGGLSMYKRTRSTVSSRYHERVRATRITALLLLLCTIILIAQTYNVFNVMLQPRRRDSSNNNNNNNNNNPYQSLAAVDQYGHVGDNANLYYLSWFTEIAALALVYQLVTAMGRIVRSRHGPSHSQETLLVQQQQHHSHASFWCHVFGTVSDHTVYTETQQQYLLPAASWHEDQHTASSLHLKHAYRLKKALWFQHLYKLRARAGIWVATLTCCLVLAASSLATWNQIFPFSDMIPLLSRSSASSPTEYLHICTRMAELATANSASYSNSKSDSNMNAIPSASLCRRTVGAWLTGVTAIGLCVSAIVMHGVNRYTAGKQQQFTTTPTWNTIAATSSSLSMNSPTSIAMDHLHQNKVPLQTELFLSCVLSCLLGFNAMFCTGVQGPAAMVGNLYYACWMALLLSLRICLGCVEEYHNIHDHGDDQKTAGEHHGNGKDRFHEESQASSQEAGYDPPKQKDFLEDEDELEQPRNATSCDTEQTDQTETDPNEKNRVKRLRGYFCLSIFSIFSCCSALDAAVNQQGKAITRSQKYMIVSPSAVAVVSAILFVLCLSQRFYQKVSSFWIGGILSIVCFGLWLVDLIITMHSEDSWAVNGIGEIEDANLYYFSWAGILTAAFQMVYFLKAMFNVRYRDNMVLVWMAICKVCVVILGASLHVWNTISDNCEFDEIAHGAVTFCSRTVLSMIFAVTGILVGGLVVFVRFCLYLCPMYQCTIMQVHVEMLVSLFLVLLFGAAAALITGIGGPGQSVGDLYYATWLAFWVSVGIFVTCYGQLQKEERSDGQSIIIELGGAGKKRSNSVVMDDPYIRMRSDDASVFV